jgi:chemotaxis response regulator CheB
MAEVAFPVVAIGASAGGVEALSSLFRRLPEGLDAAFVIVTHLAPHRQSLLPDIIARCTTMPVATAVDGQVPERGRVILNPPDSILSMSGGRLVLRERSGERNLIDIFLTSLAESAGENAIAAILSGTGSDGAIGVKAVREGGGFTLAQGADGVMSSHHGMPDAAIATGFVDSVLPIEDLAVRIAAYVGAMAEGSTALRGGRPARIRTPSKRPRRHCTACCKIAPGMISAATRTRRSCAGSNGGCRCDRSPTCRPMSLWSRAIPTKRPPCSATC